MSIISQNLKKKAVTALQYLITSSPFRLWSPWGQVSGLSLKQGWIYLEPNGYLSNSQINSVRDRGAKIYFTF